MGCLLKQSGFSPPSQRNLLNTSRNGFMKYGSNVNEWCLHAGEWRYCDLTLPDNRGDPRPFYLPKPFGVAVEVLHRPDARNREKGQMESHHDPASEKGTQGGRAKISAFYHQHSPCQIFRWLSDKDVPQSSSTLLPPSKGH